MSLVQLFRYGPDADPNNAAVLCRQAADLGDSEAQYLMAHRRDPQISAELDSRDIWIIPMVNPDGSEFDISTGTYQFWRKNRRDNKDGTFGVDLNRNLPASDFDASNPRDGGRPLSQPESAALFRFVNMIHPDIILSAHADSTRPPMVSSAVA